MVGRRVILGDQLGQEVLEVGQSGYWDGPRAWNGDFPRACVEEPELEVEMLGFFPPTGGIETNVWVGVLGVGLGRPGGPVWQEFPGR